MAFEDIFGAALNRTPDDRSTEGAAPSMDLLSKSAFVDVVMEAKHHHMHRDMFQSIVADGPLEVFSGDPFGEPLPGMGSTDMSVVENLPERLPSRVLDEVLGDDPSRELGLDLVTTEQPSARDIVRNLVRSA